MSNVSNTTKRGLQSNNVIAVKRRKTARRQMYVEYSEQREEEMKRAENGQSWPLKQRNEQRQIQIQSGQIVDDKETNIVTNKQCNKQRKELTSVQK